MTTSAALEISSRCDFDYLDPQLPIEEWDTIPRNNPDAARDKLIDVYIGTDGIASGQVVILPAKTHPNVEKVCTGLWRFQSELGGLHHPCNGYLLQVDNRWILIDPPEDMGPAIIGPVIGSSLISDIYITHLQDEHAAGAIHYPAAMLHVPKGDEYLCKGQSAYAQGVKAVSVDRDWESLGYAQGHVAGALNERPLAEKVALGDSLVPGTNANGFEIIGTPGHGKSSVTLIAKVHDKRIAFCGDLIYSGGRLWNWFDCDWDLGSELGQKTLLASARRLRGVSTEMLCPAHGAVIANPAKDLNHLILSLEGLLALRGNGVVPAINFPEPAERLPGWRELSPHIFQWIAGNSIILLSDDGHAIVIDDGLCLPKSTVDPVAAHDEIFRQAKSALGIQSIEWVIPTHFHGNHTDMIAHLARAEGAQTLCLGSIAGPLENPELYNLAGSSTWYGVENPNLVIDQKLAENERFFWRGYQLRLFQLGGETWYNQGIEVVVDGLRALIVGDSFWGGSRTAGPVLTWNDAEPMERGAVYALRKMKDSRPDLLVCGHGSALRDPDSYIRSSLTDWYGRMAIFDCLNPRATSDEFFSPFEREE